MNDGNGGALYPLPYEHVWGKARLGAHALGIRQIPAWSNLALGNAAVEHHCARIDVHVGEGVP